jgi:thioredoxin-related protein
MRFGAIFPEAVSDMLWATISRQALLAAILAFAAAPAGAQDGLYYADDLATSAREAAARRVPLMIVFTEASCGHCARAKRDYLVPLQSKGTFADKVLVREVDVASNRKLRQFDGQATTHREFARSRGVHVVPTVAVMDSRGKPLAQPIVGLLTPDFYRLYLEQAIEEGLFKLRAAR